MENISILNLFNSAVSATELPKMTQTTGQGEFENVFKKYLDRSGDQTQNQTDTDTDRKIKTMTDTSERKVTDEQAAEEPETPEEVIDSLDIPEEQKAELKQMLAEAETEEDISGFFDELISMMQEAEESAEEIEKALTEMAMTVLSSEEQVNTKDSMILEETLNRIAAVQAEQRNTPRLTVVSNDQAQQTQKMQQAQQQAQTSDQNSGGESRKDAMAAMIQKNQEQQLPQELREKIAQLVTKETDVKIQASSDTGNSFEAKTEFSEKIIRTEIKIESPRDIMKFAELVELAKSQKANKLNVQLHPQELGRVSIELTEQAGKVSGKVVFESESARNLFTSNAEGLRQQLADKGIIVENLEFLFKDFDQHEFAGWEGREGKKHGSSGQIPGMPAEEEAEESQDSGIYA